MLFFVWMMLKHVVQLKSWHSFSKWLSLIFMRMSIIKDIQSFCKSSKFMGGSQCYCCGLDPYPSKISEFTLICHCKFSNIIYKCITTISANKLKPSLNEVIGKYQPAFIREET